MLKLTFHFLHMDRWAELALHGNFWLMSVSQAVQGEEMDFTRKNKKRRTHCVWHVLQNRYVPVHLASPFPSNKSS